MLKHARPFRLCDDVILYFGDPQKRTWPAAWSLFSDRRVGGVYERIHCALIAEYCPTQGTRTRSCGRPAWVATYTFMLTSCPLQPDKHPQYTWPELMFCLCRDSRSSAQCMYTLHCTQNTSAAQCSAVQYIQYTVLATWYVYPGMRDNFPLVNITSSSK